MAHKSLPLATVVFGHPTSEADRQALVTKVETRLGKLDWSFTTDETLGGGARLKVEDRVTDLTGVGRARRLLV